MLNFHYFRITNFRKVCFLFIKSSNHSIWVFISSSLIRCMRFTEIYFCILFNLLIILFFFKFNSIINNDTFYTTRLFSLIILYKAELHFIEFLLLIFLMKTTLVFLSVNVNKFWNSLDFLPIMKSASQWPYSCFKSIVLGLVHIGSTNLLLNLLKIPCFLFLPFI